MALKTELLAPAGNLERLKWAVVYGADAVYFGITDFSLRSFAGNFTLDDARLGLDYLHQNGRKGYVTLNIYPFSNEYDELMRTAAELDEMGADAFIVSDLGVMRALRQLNLKTPIHVSTQANTTSWQAVLAYRDLGAKRVNLARELSMEQIKEIQRNLEGEQVETEVFIHGSVCFSYSGRCAISDYLTGRMANRGECTQPCRWNYTLMEEKRPGQHFPVFEDERGLYLFNSRDLALFPFVPDLVNCGVASLKIEGRMKNVHYLAAVLSVYRAVLDGKAMPEEIAYKMLGRVSNRGYTFGFMKGRITPDDYETSTHKYQSTSVMVASTTEQMHGEQRVCRVKNTIQAGEQLELLTPNGVSSYTLPNPLVSLEGESIDHANNQDVILLNNDLPPYAVLRRVYS
ncbi:MAG: U32 family peptidase C-terminal domain-containing protein [Armatimonadota bacterium]|nr:U32 family peptidase [bacterium]